jgi:hypothetical protein
MDASSKRGTGVEYKKKKKNEMKGDTSAMTGG